MHKETPEDIQVLLKALLDHFDIEERSVRERQIRVWRKLKLYWNSFQRVYYDEVAHDWRIPNDERIQEASEGSYYDKPINVFRAYLESIIAALSVTIPVIDCAPDDADNPLDLQTAKAGNKIAELVYKHNDVVLLWLHALYIFCTEGLVAAYSYSKEDESYGTYKIPKYENENIEKYVCPECGAQMEDETFTDQLRDLYAPDDMPLQELQGPVCPECAVDLDPNLQKSPLVVTKLVGVTTQPKTRQCIEVYGGLYVKVPNYARKQADIPYLIFSYETHYANVIERYPHLRDKFTGTSKVGPAAGGLYEPYETWGRLSPQYNGEYPINNVTVRNCWFRPASFNILQEEDTDKLKKLYPKGVRTVFINELFAEAENESLDDCWTLTHNPLSDYLHHDPLGMLLTSVQDITNDLISLIQQTIEHGIPQTFADPAVLNFNQYNQTEVAPGMIYPATPKSGKSVGDAFYEVKTATLSQEVLPFAQNIQNLGQLVSGALPSLFGGGNVEGSKTAAEYSMSRAQALQRLQTPWKMLNIWWKTIFGKVIPSYIKCMLDDERYVEKTKEGDFVNVFIRKAELEGKLGDVELEGSEQLPITWAQKKDVIMQLMNAGNPLIIEALTSPQNIPFIKDAIGLNEFVIPGEDDRTKQYEEIKQLINSEPIVLPPDPQAMMAVQAGLAPPEVAQPQELPSVEVDPILDNHQLEADICRRWLISDVGRLAKLENPQGYKNVLLHLKAHMDIVAQQMMQQQMMAAQSGNAAPEGKPQNQSLAAKSENKDEPVTIQ